MLSDLCIENTPIQVCVVRCDAADDFKILVLGQKCEELPSAVLRVFKTRWPPGMVDPRYGRP